MPFASPALSGVGASPSLLDVRAFHVQRWQLPCEASKSDRGRRGSLRMHSSKSLQPNWFSSWPRVDKRPLPYSPSAKGRGRSPAPPGPKQGRALAHPAARDGDASTRQKCGRWGSIAVPRADAHSSLRAGGDGVYEPDGAAMLAEVLGDNKSWRRVDLALYAVLRMGGVTEPHLHGLAGLHLSGVMEERRGLSLH